MTTQTLPAVETSNLGYRGFQVPETLKWEGDLRNNFGIKAYEASIKSVTTTTWLSLYRLGEDIIDYEERGEKLPEEIMRLREGDREIGKALYLDCQKRAGLREPKEPWEGVWFKDAVEYDAKKPRSTIVPKGYVFAEFIKDVEDWDIDEEKGVYVPQGGKIIPVEIPASSGAFAVPDGIHVYDPLTGVPRKVETDRKRALKTFMDTGLTENQAERRLSRVYTVDSGIAVVRSSADPDGGPLYLSFLYGPWVGFGNIGSVAASRLPSGARHDSVNVVPESEYNRLSEQNRKSAIRADNAERKLADLRKILDKE